MSNQTMNAYSTHTVVVQYSPTEYSDDEEEHYDMLTSQMQLHYLPKVSVKNVSRILQ